jgi:hypothetical protein
VGDELTTGECQIADDANVVFDPSGGNVDELVVTTSTTSSSGVLSANSMVGDEKADVYFRQFDSRICSDRGIVDRRGDVVRVEVQPRSANRGIVRHRGVADNDVEALAEFGGAAVLLCVIRIEGAADDAYVAKDALTEIQTSTSFAGNVARDLGVDERDVLCIVGEDGATLPA